MKPDWESGFRGRVYALGRALVPLSWRRALRRRLPAEQLLGIRKPETPKSWLPLEPGLPRADRDDVVVLPVIAWSYRRQRPQQLAEALARRGRRVFYGSVAGEGEPRDAVGAARGVTLLPLTGPRREDLPEGRLGAKSLAEAISGLETARGRFGLTRATLLVQSPFWEPLAAEARQRFGWRIVYDCLDAHAEFSTNRPRALADAEQALVHGADLVVATSESLRQRLAESNPGARLLPNACDFELFEAVPLPRVESVPPPIVGAGPLTVGYVGAVDEWFDMELLDRMAALAPDWRFEIVGGLEGATRHSLRRDNVLFHGERPHAEMPAFRGRFDVEIIPFRLTPLTHATDPVKLYEAAASGRPIVATPMESLRPYERQGIVRLAGTPEEFHRAIIAAAKDRAAGASRQRAFARENTWDVRAATLTAWIDALPRADARRLA